MLSLSLAKNLKDNGNDSGQEPKEKGWQELLEEMFSRVKEQKEDVRTSDQRTGKDAQGRKQRTIRSWCGLGEGRRVDDEQRAFVAQLLGIWEECWRITCDGEGRRTIS